MQIYIFLYRYEIHIWHGIYTLNAKTSFFFFWPCHMACRLLVPQPGLEPGPSAVKASSPSHWTAREFPKTSFFLALFFSGIKVI